MTNKAKNNLIMEMEDVYEQDLLLIEDLGECPDGDA